jgi:hypothetical protein
VAVLTLQARLPLCNPRTIPRHFVVCGIPAKTARFAPQASGAAVRTARRLTRM